MPSLTYIYSNKLGRLNNWSTSEIMPRVEPHSNMLPMSVKGTEIKTAKRLELFLLLLIWSLFFILLLRPIESTIRKPVIMQKMYQNTNSSI